MSPTWQMGTMWSLSCHSFPPQNSIVTFCIKLKYKSEFDIYVIWCFDIFGYFYPYDLPKQLEKISLTHIDTIICVWWK